MDHVSLDAARLKPARQPEAVAAGFEGKRNPRDRAADPNRLILPAMQQGKQPFWARIELLARLTLNAGKHAGNEPARLAHLDDGNDRAILVQVRASCAPDAQCREACRQRASSTGSSRCVSGRSVSALALCLGLVRNRKPLRSSALPAVSR
jgi:hypothetical protein